MEAAAYHASVIAAFTKWAQGDESQDKLPSVLRDGVATVMHQQRDALAAKDAEILRLRAALEAAKTLINAKEREDYANTPEAFDTANKEVGEAYKRYHAARAALAPVPPGTGETK